MKPEELYHQLKELAQKLGIKLSEQNLRKTGVPVASGLCKVKGEHMFIMNKHLPVREKNCALAACIGRMSCEDIYIVPAVRKFINRVKKD